MSLKEKLKDFPEEILLADGFDEAFIGIGWQFVTPVAVYDKARCIEILKSQGMDEIDAIEYFEFNVAGAYAGEQTPIFLEKTEELIDY